MPEIRRCVSSLGISNGCRKFASHFRISFGRRFFNDFSHRKIGVLVRKIGVMVTEKLARMPDTVIGHQSSDHVAAIIETRISQISFRSVCQWISYVFFLLPKGTVTVKDDFVREAVVIASLRKVSRAMIFCLLFVLIPEG